MTADGSFPYDPTPKQLGPGNEIIDNGSFVPTPVPGATTAHTVAHASNFLMVAAKRSTNHHPLFVAGPQIGYYYPGLTSRRTSRRRASSPAA